MNADVLLSQHLMLAIGNIAKEFSEFLLLGKVQEIMPPPTQIDFTAEWYRDFKPLSVASQSRFDYFVFRSKQILRVPVLAAGKADLATWLIFENHSRGVPIIDASNYIKAYHQQHDYRHTKWGTKERLENCVEIKDNSEFLQSQQNKNSICLASHCLSSDGVCTKNPVLPSFQLENSIDCVNAGLLRYCQKLQLAAMELVKYHRCESAWAKLERLKYLLPNYPGLPMLRAICLRGLNRLDEARIEAQALIGDPTFGRSVQEFLEII